MMNDLINIVADGHSARDMHIGDVYCSFVPDTPEGKKALYKAMSEADCKVSDCLNINIDLKDIYVEMVQILNDATGEYQPVPRVVLFDRTGKSYGGNSWGLMRSVERLLRVYGDPGEWGEPLTVQVVQQAIKNGKRTYTLRCV